MIKLTIKYSKRGNGELLYINPKNIISLFWLTDDKRTQIVLSGNTLDYVSETPEEILELIKRN